MRYLSLFSGIEAATVAWKPLGWTPYAFAEIEKFPSAVLAHHYGSNMPGEPLSSNGVPNFGDVTKFKEWPNGPIDLICGGSPCQSFSVAGLRKGMDDPRGNLALVYLAIVNKYRPRWVVYENVPGLLSSNGGRDFGSFIGGLAELGYGFAYRVLDAQYVRVDGFGRAVPQRRRRVFVVGYLGDWRRAAAVLLEPQGMRGDTAPRREQGKRVAPTIASRPTGGGGLGTDFDLDGGLIASTGDVAHYLNAGGMGRQDYETETMVAHTLKGEGFDASEDGTGRGTPLVPVCIHSDAIGRTGDAKAPSLDAAGSYRVRDAGLGIVDDGSSYNLMATGHPHAVAFDMRGREGGAQFEGPHDTANIRAASGGSSKSYVVANEERKVDASQTEGDTAAPLRRMRDEVGEEAFTQWGLGILDSFQSPEILRSEVHGREFRQTSQARSKVVGGAPRGKVSGLSGAVREMRDAGRNRRPPQGSKLSEQCAGELGAYLSQLSQSGAFDKIILRDLWRSSQGIGILREALSALQEVWRPDADETQPAHSAWAARRLTPKECERLMGFPDGFTDVPWRGKEGAPDGPRYKALGNSFAVNVMRWIGRRIEMVEKITKGEAA